MTVKITLWSGSLKCQQCGTMRILINAPLKGLNINCETCVAAGNVDAMHRS